MCGGDDMPVDSFVFYRSFMTAAKKMSDSERLALYDGLISYALDDKLPELADILPSIAWDLIKPNLDKNKKRREDGAKGGPHGTKGGRPPKNPIGVNDENPIGVSIQTPDVDVDVDVDGDKDKDINSSGFAEKKFEKDFEKVKTTYLKNWASLYADSLVKTKKPIVNWNQTKSLLKKHFANKLDADQIIQAINNGMKDDFALSECYTLNTLLSASVMNRLVNSLRYNDEI